MKLIMMLIICFVPADHGTIKEAWRIQKLVEPDVCYQMNTVFAQGGKYGVVTVQCGGAL